MTKGDKMEEKARILIVDDDKSVSKSLSLILEKKGYYTQWAGTGKEALTKAKESAFNVALIDLRLPDTSGVELVEPLKKLNPNTALMIVTGHASLDTSVQAMDKGVFAYLIKPLNMDEMLQRVEDILTRQGLIEEKQQAEEALKDSEERYRGLFENSSEFLFTLDLKGNFTNVNKAAVELTGHTKSELLKMNFKDYTHRSDHRELFRAFYNVFKTGKPLKDFPVKAIVKDKTEKYFETNLSPLRKGDEIIGFQGSSKDITEQRKAEQAIRKLSQFRESIIDNTNMWLNVLDQKANIILWNKAAERISGYSQEEVVGHDKIWEWLYPDEAYRNEVTEQVVSILAKGAAQQDLETTIHCKDGQQRIIAWNQGNLLDEDGEFIGSIALGHDITEQSRAQQAETTLQAQLYQSQKLESIGTLASGIAHEINNPLMGIINYAQLIHDRIKDEKLKEFSDGIMKEGNRVGAIVKNLLSFARQEKETHSPAYISDIIEASLSLIGAVLRKDQITIEQDIPDDLPKIKCRSQQIEQVILNLLTNARDALNKRYEGYHEHKVVRISVRPFEREGEKWIRTTVEDHGTGIPQDLSNRVFDPFYSTKPREEGTGLGLSVSYGIVKEHRGELTVESKLGDYTRFYMDLRLDNEWSPK